jgi:type I restriction enzyme M protein
MLIRAKEYVNEHGGNDADVRLFGQGPIPPLGPSPGLTSCYTASRLARCYAATPLADPLHTAADGRLMLFDRALANPPFSMSYARKQVRYPSA